MSGCDPRLRGFLGAFSIALLLAGCSVPPRLAHQSGQAAMWTGRLALRVESDPVQSFTAGFELKGDAKTGALSLYSPLGLTVAQLNWTPGDARLRSNGAQLSFESMDALAKHATGTELPIASIFLWLAGENADAGGWQADLRDVPNGRLVARRMFPAPSVEMRLVFE